MINIPENHTMKAYYCAFMPKGKGKDVLVLN